MLENEKNDPDSMSGAPEEKGHALSATNAKLDRSETGKTRAFFAGLLVNAALYAGMMLAVTYDSGVFGIALFLLAPGFVTFTAVFVYGRLHPTNPQKALWLALQYTLLSVVTLIVVGLEGVVCVIIALPLLIPIAIVGGTLAAVILEHCNKRKRSRNSFLLMAFAPFLALDLESRYFEPQVQTVTTSIEIAAPPDVVWRYVPALTLPDNPNVHTPWVFALGYGKPLSCHIEGSGVGAQRFCHLHRGTFGERVTVWEENEELTFSVEEQPQWVKGYVRMVQGSIKLVRLPNGHTRMDRITSFENRCQPAWYFDWWCEQVVDGAHQYVLDHIKCLAEANHAHQ